MDKVLNSIKINESHHSERKWALEPESKPEIEEIHLHHKDMSNKWITPLTPMDTYNLPPYGQSVEI